ncbi:unnamed protein product, partial [Didymodactylos carnosus]
MEESSEEDTEKQEGIG